MAKKLTSILKGKLTGEEIGRIIIQDLITSYKNALEGKTGGIFAFEEVQQAIDNLKETHDIKAYNCYHSLHDYLIKAAQLNGIHIKQSEVCFWRLAYNINDIKTAEQSNAASRFDPVIVTQKQFNDMKEKDFADKMTWTESFESLMFQALRYYINLYNEGKRTPLNKYFIKAKTEIIKNQRIKETYWEEDMQDTSAPPEATHFDVLENASGFYASDETDTQETFWEFKADYPALYNTLLNEIFKAKGIEFLKDTPETEYFNNELITYKALYENKLFGYPSIVDKLIPNNNAISGIAVLYENGVVLPNRIDKNGYYKPKQPYFIEQHLTENSIESKQEAFETWYKDLFYGIRHLYAAQEAFNIIAERIDMPEIPILLDPGNIEDLIEYLNTIIEHTVDDIIRPDREQREKVKRLFIETFPPVDLNALKPLKENIDAARLLIDDLGYFRTREDLVDVIKGGVSNA